MNLGARRSQRAPRSPLFSDGTFEFVPSSDGHIAGLPTYSSFKSLSRRPVEDFVPRSYLDQAMHNDPEFETFTYGDRPDLKSGAAPLREMNKGDSLFFLARLVEWDDENRWGRVGLYLIGEFVLDQVIMKSNAIANPELLEVVKNNAHVMRWHLSPSLERRNFWVFVGSRESRRFRHAVPFDERIVNRVLQTSDEKSAKKQEDAGKRHLVGQGNRECLVIHDPASISNLDEYTRGRT